MKNFLIVAFFFIATLMASGVAYYFYSQYQSTSRLLKDPKEAARVETSKLVGDVSRYMELPRNEQPTLATVTDATKLNNQDFFKNSRNGDKVLIYMQARQAILFRPSTKKIIAVAPVNLQNNQEQGTVAGAETQPSVTPGVKVPLNTPLPTKAPLVTPAAASPTPQTGP